MLSFTIVVTEANARVRPIHDRMPVEIKNVTSFTKKFGDYSGYLDAIGPEEREIAGCVWWGIRGHQSADQSYAFLSAGSSDRYSMISHSKPEASW